jgi:hypothetical protein
MAQGLPLSLGGNLINMALSERLQASAAAVLVDVFTESSHS